MTQQSLGAGPRPGAAARRWRVAARVAFVGIPLLSFGYLTGPVFAFAAARLRSWLLGTAAAGYLAITIAMCALPEGAPNSALETVLFIGFGVNMVVGAAHAAVVQHRLFRDVGAEPPPDPAVAAALARRQRRRAARLLLERDPALAAELCVGRPDLPRSYDDGGLIDINAVPAEVLTRLPGLTPDQVERILAARQGPMGLTGVPDLVVYADVPPAVAESLGELLIFRSGFAAD